MARDLTNPEEWIEALTRKLGSFGEEQHKQVKKGKYLLEDNAERLLSDPESRAYLSGPYLDHLRENLRDLSSAFGRSLTLVLLIMAAFELLSRAAVGGVNIGPFEVSDLSLVQVALPVIGSYLFYDIQNIVIRGGEVNGVYRRLLERLHPNVAQSDLLILIAPHRSSLIPQRIPGAKPSGLHARLSLLLYTSLMLAVPLWLIYAFIVLFYRFHLSSVMVWVASVVSFLFVVLGFAVLRTVYEKGQLAGFAADRHDLRQHTPRG
jgi:hypothetical protein